MAKYNVEYNQTETYSQAAILLAKAIWTRGFNGQYVDAVLRSQAILPVHDEAVAGGFHAISTPDLMRLLKNEAKMMASQKVKQLEDLYKSLNNPVLMETLGF